MRYAARKDANQGLIVDALRNAGAYVWDIELPVDLLVGYKGHTILMEVKRGDKARMTPLQQEFFKTWPGATLIRVDSVEAALSAIKVCDVE